MSTKAWIELDQPFINMHWQAAILLDLVLCDSGSSHRLLSSTGLFYEDLLKGDCRLSAKKFYRLIANCEKYYPGSDLAFRFGQRLLAGSHGDFSQTLISAATLGQALEVVHHFGFFPSPLLTPQVLAENDVVELRWYPAFQRNETHRFLCESSMSAFANRLQSLVADDLPWHFEFDFMPPKSPEIYEVNFSPKVLFNRPVCKMSLPRECLQLDFETRASISFQHGWQCLQRSAEAQCFTGFLHFIYQFVRARIIDDLSLEQAAESLSMSAATLKRKLKQHGVNYRRLLDQVRMDVAVNLVEKRGYTNEQVAAHLGFYDEANYRRSFKRWTGLNPSQYFLAQV